MRHLRLSVILLLCFGFSTSAFARAEECYSEGVEGDSDMQAYYDYHQNVTEWSSLCDDGSFYSGEIFGDQVPAICEGM